MKDKESTQYRHEEGDGHGSVKGSYGYTDDKGIYREVQYVADKQGFRAKINTNEPGTSNQDSAGVEIQSNAKHQEYHPPIHHIQQNHHIPVYHKEVAVPVFHKVDVAPIRPLKSFHSYNSFNNFSPIHGFSYKPISFYKHRPISGFNSVFRNNLRSYSGNSNIHNSFENKNLGNHFGYLNSYNHDDLEKILEDLKNKRHSSIENFSGLENFDAINGFSNDNFNNFEDFSNLESYKNIGGYSNVGGRGSAYEFDGINKDSIEKLIEEANRQNNHAYSNNQGNFNINNDFHFKEFRNIGDHKYSRSSDNDFN